MIDRIRCITLASCLGIPTLAAAHAPIDAPGPAAIAAPATALSADMRRSTDLMAGLPIDVIAGRDGAGRRALYRGLITLAAAERGAAGFPVSAFAAEMELPHVERSLSTGALIAAAGLFMWLGQTERRRRA